MSEDVRDLLERHPGGGQQACGAVAQVCSNVLPFITPAALKVDEDLEKAV